MNKIRLSTQAAQDGAAKGGIVVWNGSAWVPLPVGSNGQVLTANSAATDGVDWEATGPGTLPTMGTYTPAWTATTTNPTLGNGTIRGRYVQLADKLVWVRISLVIGSTTTLGSGNYVFSLPAGFTPVAGGTGALDRLVGRAVNAGSLNYRVIGMVDAATNTVLRTYFSDGANQGLTNNQPGTWVTGNTIDMSGHYEIA